MGKPALRPAIKNKISRLLSPSRSASLLSTMATVYAVAPRPTSLAVCIHPTPRPRLRSTHIQAGPSTPHATTLKKKPSLTSASSIAAAKRKRNETPDDSSGDSASPQPPRKPREGPKKKKANRACYHCQKAHLTCDDCEHSHLVHPVFSHRACSSPMSALYQTWICQQLHRRPPQKSKVPAR